MPDQPFAEIEQRLSVAADGKFRVFGIRRTGQHAIINWILRNSGRKASVFLNSCTMGRSPVRTCGQSELNGSQSGKAHGLHKSLSAYLDHYPRPFLLISYEAGYKSGEVSPNFETAGFDHEVLITRSFVNWLPSFIRLMWQIHQPANGEVLDISNGIIFEISRYKAHLQAAIASEATVICFDKWATLPEYRMSMLKNMGLNPVDNTLGKVQFYGRGSSFSGQSLPADELTLTRRWETMSDDSYAKLFLQLAQADDEFMQALALLYPDNPQIIAGLLAENT